MTILKRKILIIAFFVLGIRIVYPQQVTLNVVIPGTLHDLIDNTEYNMHEITDLKIIGKINGQDISWIRFMAGCPEQGTCWKSLHNLDLSQARIVRGDIPYRIKGYASQRVYSKTDTITRYMFEGAKALKKVILPNNVKCIDEYAFFGCNDLIDIRLSDSLKSIGFCAFSNCAGISRGLKSLSLPLSLSFIAPYAFNGCFCLTDINIPDSIKSINEKTFEGCFNLRRITFGKGVKNIEKEAFGNCVKLRTLTIFAEEPPVIAPKAFYGIDISKITVFVPRDRIKVYQMSPYWGDFKIKEIK